VHHEADELPRLVQDKVALTVIAGEMFGLSAPIRFPHPIVYAEVRMTAGGFLTLPGEWGERAVYPVSGAAAVAGAALEPGTMAVLEDGKSVVLSASEDAVVMVLGGQPYPEARHLEWNFVHHDKDRIARAVEDWREGQFDKVPGDDEYIPY